MILSDLIGHRVFDESGAVKGRVSDLRFVIDSTPGQLLADARLYGVIVSPHGLAYFGYERSLVNRPALIARFLAWRSRGSFLVEWTDVAVIRADGVHLRARYEARDAALPGAH
jgi:hypothetical protein